MEPNILLLALVALLSMLCHMLWKIKKNYSLSDGTVDASKFFVKEWPYIGISILTIAIITIAHQNIAKLHYAGIVAGDWMYLVFAFIGWFSSSIMYNTFGRLEKKVIQDLKERTKGA